MKPEMVVLEFNSHTVVIHRMKTLTFTHPLAHNYQQILNDFQSYILSQSQGPGCASQDPEASVGGPFAILSDLGPSKGTEAELMVGKTR